MKLLAIDLGYSSVKVAYYNDAGALQLEKFISAVAKIDDPMEMDDDIMFKLGVDTYVLGESALKVSRSSLLPLESFDDMKAAYPVWISYLLKRYGGSDSFDKVVIGLSLAFSERTDELLEHLYQTLMIPIESDYFMCLPQGLSCKLAYSNYGLNIRSESHSSTKLMNYIVVDGGFLTVDMCAVVASGSSSGSAIGIPNTGVINIAYDVVDYLFREYQFKVSVKEAQQIIDSNGIFTRRARKYDISGPLKDFTKKYLSNVLGLLEEKYSEFLDVIDGVVILGGLAYIFQRYLDDPDIIAEIEKHFDVSFLSFPPDLSEYYNSYSYLKAAEKLLNK